MMTPRDDHSAPATSNGMFKPLEKKRYSDQIAELIKERIRQDRLGAGTGLPSEKDLAVEFQVSRSVIREALRILESSGLIRIKKGPTGGIFVSQTYHKPLKQSLDNLISAGEVTIDHLFDVRLLIEPRIAMEAARHCTKADAQKLEALLDDSEQHPDDPFRLKENNLNFHLLLAKASGNPVFSILLESVIELLIERSLDFLDLNIERHFFQIHKDIYRVISNKQPEEAKRLVEADILDIREKLKGFGK